MVSDFQNLRKDISSCGVVGVNIRHVDAGETGGAVFAGTVWRRVGELACRDAAVYTLAFLISKSMSKPLIWSFCVWNKEPRR